MAPSRRRGAGKAAAVAAACRQWKVGDLVLAKVKGFPAWPAAVSEPEKWGYSTDWKKVLVHFFGTQQIAFCNPADVEAFTEEKKQSLLTKRHAKGSDFVRAVKEIIESFENLKQQEQAGDPQSAEEGAGIIPLLPQVSENPTGTSFDTQMNSDPSNGRDESTLLSEDASAAEQMLALRENSVTCNNASDIAVVKEPLKIATYSSRRRNGGARSQKCGPQKKICSVQRSKSSSRLQSDKLQRSMLQNSDGGQSIDDVEDVALRRRKRIRRSPGHSESDDVASSALNSHASDGENASEIATVESGNNARNEGNGVDSGSKVEFSDTGGQPHVGDYEVNKGLNFQINTMVKRKKRKPTRKRGTSDVVDLPDKVEADAVIEDGARENVQASQNSHEGFTERPSEGNGDEHLPLVKRARVRMSRAFYGDHEANGYLQVEERSSKDTLVSATAQTSLSDNVSSHDCYAADMVNVVPSPEEKPSNGMSPSVGCVQIVGGKKCAMGWNELYKAPDDEAARLQNNQVSISSADEAQIATVSGAACSGDSQLMNLPTTESDLPFIQCLRHVAKSETPLDPDIVDSSANKATGICPSGIPSHLPGQHRSQDEDACEILDNSRETLNEKCDTKDVCVVQVVQSESIEHSPSSFLMGNKQETENMQKAENLLLKEEHGSLGEKYDNVKPTQTTPNPTDVCVAQVVQSEAIENSPSSCLMGKKQEIENMQKAENLLLKEEHGSLGEKYDNVKPTQTTPNPKDVCVAQVVQSEAIEDSPSSCLMGKKQEIENMQKAENLLLKEEHGSLGEKYDNVKPTQTTPNRKDVCVAQVVQSEAIEDSPSSCLMGKKQQIENMQKAENLLLKEEHGSLGEKNDNVKPTQTTPNRKDVCVAQVVQSEAIEDSPSSCLMGKKREIENMQKAENLLLKEELGNLGENYDNVKPTQTTPNPAISATESDVIVDESELPNETGYSIYGDVVENSRQLEVIGEADNQKQQVQTNNSVSVSENLSFEKMSLSPANIADTPAKGTPRSNSVYHISTAESGNDMLNNSSCSPNVQSSEKKTVYDAIVKVEEKIETGVCKGPKVVSSDVQSTREAFEDALSSLVRTKESIGRATRLAMDLMKFGVSVKAMEILAHTLESESNLQRRVDLFFLVDSIAQCSKGLKGDAGCVYLSAIQVILPRLLAAAVPAGATTQENRRQCLKVLRLWLERRILPESIVRHHIRELDSHSIAPACLYSRRSARTERSLDDPVRDMEGMLVDEYGSNSTLQLPGFCMPAMLKDEDGGSDSDEGDFESVTPEHESRILEEHVSSSTAERHTLILEDVDGELEMEDVAPPWETGNCTHTDQTDNTMATSCQLGQQQRPVSGTSHQHVSSSSPPLPSSSPAPPPPPPAPPSQQAQCAMSDSYSNGFDSGGYPSVHGDHQAGPVRMNPPMPGNTMHYQGPESSYSSGVQLTNSMPQADGSNFQHRPYPSHPHPPPPPSQHQYSYTEQGHHIESRRDGPSYSHRSHYVPNFDERNFHDNQEGMRHAPYENRDNWRYPPPSSYGSRYQDKHKGPYPSSSHNGGPPRESGRFQNYRWDHPPRPYNNRHSFHPKPHSEGPVPVGMRDPGMWHQRGE